MDVYVCREREVRSGEKVFRRRGEVCRKYAHSDVISRSWGSSGVNMCDITTCKVILLSGTFFFEDCELP